MDGPGVRQGLLGEGRQRQEAQAWWGLKTIFSTLGSLPSCFPSPSSSGCGYHPLPSQAAQEKLPGEGRHPTWAQSPASRAGALPFPEATRLPLPKGSTSPLVGGDLREQNQSPSPHDGAPWTARCGVPSCGGCRLLGYRLQPRAAAPGRGGEATQSSPWE